MRTITFVLYLLLISSGIAYSEENLSMVLQGRKWKADIGLMKQWANNNAKDPSRYRYAFDVYVDMELTFTATTMTVAFGKDKTIVEVKYLAQDKNKIVFHQTWPTGIKLVGMYEFNERRDTIYSYYGGFNCTDPWYEIFCAQPDP